MRKVTRAAGADNGRRAAAEDRGERAWYLPRWLGWLPHLEVERHAPPPPPPISHLLDA